MYSSELDDSLESSWAWVQKFMDEIYTVAFQVLENAKDRELCAFGKIFDICKRCFFFPRFMRPIPMSFIIWKHCCQPAIDGRSLLAIKFVESVILLYTPNPNVSSEPPSDINAEGISCGYP